MYQPALSITRERKMILPATATHLFLCFSVRFTCAVDFSAAAYAERDKLMLHLLSFHDVKQEIIVVD